MSVLAVFDTAELLEGAVDRLREAGFKRSELDVWQRSAVASGSEPSGDRRGTGTGVVAGLFLGALCGWLAGSGAVAIPGLERLPEFGTEQGLLLGVIAGLVVGAFAGMLSGGAVPEGSPERMTAVGGAVISVRTASFGREAVAHSILRQTGGKEIAIRPDALPLEQRSDLHGAATAASSRR